jgi:uncharacterized protein YktB (UPF0637 family)
MLYERGRSMEEILVKSGVQYGIFAALFIWLLIYVLKENSKREEAYRTTIADNQEIIKGLTDKLDIVDDIKEDVSVIKEEIKDLRK